MTEHLPLQDRLIVEHVHAGTSEVTQRAIALAGRIAADLGGRVVRLVPATGDPLAQAPPTVAAGASATHLFLNAGKTIVQQEQAAQWPAADAILTDAPTALPAVLRDIAVQVVVGHGAPASLAIPDARITDTTILALSGLLDLMGDPQAAPVPLGGHQAAGLAGLAAFSGMMAAFAKGGRETVRVSALEACLWSNWKSYAERLYMGRTPTRQGRLAEWQALPCKDGFATFVYLEKDWPAVCRMIGDPRLSAPPLDTQAGRRADQSAVYAVVRPWYAAHTRAEIYARAKAQGLPVAPVLSVAEVIGDPQFAAQNFFAAPVDRISAAARVPTIPTAWNGRRFPPRAAVAGGAPRQKGAPSEHSSRPLEGCRVVDLGIITAGASTSALLADLGADVIKVEASAYIDPFRTWDKGLGAPDWWDRSRFFEFTNRNKRGLALDLKSARCKELFLDLIAKSDVVVENFRRGVLERLGLGWEVLSARNPRLVLLSVTSQGEHGPEAGAASYGSTLEANSGLADLTRGADGAPLISGILLNYPDQIVAIYAAGIATLAVMEQRRTGRGARLDVSQRELASFLIGEHILAASSGGNPHAGSRPRLVRSADGRWLACHGASEGALDDALSTLAPGGRAAVDAAALTTALASRDIQAVPVRNGDDMLAAVERGETRLAFAKAPDGSDAKGVPFALDGVPFAIHCRAPRLGQHNAQVMRDVLGQREAAIAQLAADGVIGTTPRA